MSAVTRGFTLIEALVVVAMLAIITTLGAPSLRDFLVRNKVASISNEFNSALMQTRALAVSKNTCANICASKDIASGSTTATCSNSSGDDFQDGWIIFVNPTCATPAAGPASASDISVMRLGDATSGYSIKPSATELSNVMFDPRGLAVLGASGNFQVDPPTSSDESFKRTVCLDAAGRASVRRTKTSGTCS